MATMKIVNVNFVIDLQADDSGTRKVTAWAYVRCPMWGCDASVAMESTRPLQVGSINASAVWVYLGAHPYDRFEPRTVLTGSCVKCGVNLTMPRQTVEELVSEVRSKVTTYLEDQEYLDRRGRRRDQAKI